MDPVRFLLQAEDIAAGFAAIGVTPPDAPLYGELPKRPGKPAEKLTNGKEALSPHAAALFHVLAAPSQSIALSVCMPGYQAAIESRIVRGGPDRQFVMLSLDQNHIWDAALLPNRDYVLAVLDDLSGLNAGPSWPGGSSIELNVPALTALAGVADLMEQERLVSQAARAPLAMDFMTQPIAVDDVLAMVERGTKEPDTRWCVSLMAVLSDGALSACASQYAIEHGVRTLVGLELIDDDGVITPIGAEVASALGGVRVATSVDALTAEGQDGFQLDRILILRREAGLLLGVWNGQQSSDLSLTLTATSADSALALLADLLGSGSDRARADDTGTIVEPTYPTSRTDEKADQQRAASSDTSGPSSKAAASNEHTGFCTKCGKALKPRARFCTACGTGFERRVN